MGKRATLKDIAKALNVSITTVSRALNDKEDISASTKKKVRETAEILDYQPNYLAKILHGGSTRLIGVIVPRISHAYFSSLLKGISEAVNNSGDFIIIAESQDDRKKELEIIQKFVNINVIALLIAPTYRSNLLDKNYTPNLLKGTPVVLMDRSTDNCMFHQVTNDHHSASRQLVKHLIDQGHKRIIHLRGLVNDIIADQISEGYAKAMEDHGLSSEVHNLSEVSAEDAYLKLDQITQSSGLPEAVFVISDEAALGIYRYCHDNGLSIPRDVALAGYSNAPFGQYLTPALTTVDQQSYTMGLKAVKLSLQVIEENISSSIIDTITTQLITRESSRKAEL